MLVYAGDNKRPADHDGDIVAEVVVDKDCDGDTLPDVYSVTVAVGAALGLIEGRGLADILGVRYSRYTH